MKKVICSIICSAVFASPAFASDLTPLQRYARFHKFAYWPIQIAGYIVAGPIMLATSWAQHHDDLLKQAAASNVSPNALTGGAK